MHPLSRLLLFFSLAGCGIHAEPVAVPAQLATPATVDHAALDAILNQFVDDRGLVDYAGMKASGTLTPYLEMLAGTDPAALSEPEEIAFWINAYNANALKLILDNYPTKSITDLVPFAPFGLKIFVPKANSPFSRKFIRIGGRAFSLDDIEHGILRARFREPRLHFALVCAALSCPPLRREAYTGPRLDEQLADQGRRFLHDRTKNEVPAAPGQIRLSKILDWYGGDFGAGEQAVQAYLARYFEGETARNLAKGAYTVSYLPYDWSLNEQQRAR